jgi:hypothetical protein
MVHFVFQTMGVLGNGRLVGYSPGGASADPGNRDISATIAGTFSLVPPTATELSPLTLAGNPRPVLGNTVVLTTSQIPTGTLLGASVLGLVKFDPGIDLTVIGMPGCFQYNNGVSTNVFVVGGPTVTNSIFIPVNNAFVGIHVLAQSATFSAGFNALGVISSNGVDLLVGGL